MGLNTLSESFSLGARSSSSGLTYSLQQSMAETYTIRSVTGGQYRSGTAQQDLVFLQENQSNSDNTDVHFRTFNTGAGTFNGSTVTTVNGVWHYTATADLNGDGYGDLIFLNPEYGSKFDQYTQEPESPPTLTIGVLMGNPGSSTPFAGSSLKTMTIDATGTTQDEVAMTDMDFADFNGDGIVDVIVAGVTAGKPLAEAPSTFNPAPSIMCTPGPTRSDWASVTAPSTSSRSLKCR
ncbi:VCBS repeat-containing protein [Roseomonas terrae]|uniref:VCBS repeat-containing protein n=1 Tax=Neoroseomonas terrae TaxID=424799 RepID=A0ABS5EHZ3_9PROT|nr:VCBS repeat-containing protein [Neoroseomonas terrae]MBR0650570.1 VCBS repeat-containing protein [Neoroseomonas terrae]